MQWWAVLLSWVIYHSGAPPLAYAESAPHASLDPASVVQIAYALPPELGLPPDKRVLLTAPAHEGAHQVARHYLWSNERRHDLFFPDIRGLGGGYIGVGADQNYSLAAAAEAEMVWLIDLDAEVIHLHDLYLALIADSPTADAFLERLADAGDGEIAAELALHYEDRRQQQGALEVFRAYGSLLLHQLQRTARFEPGRVSANWLNDPALYASIRRLVREGRVVARVGDLNGPRTMQQIAGAARAAQVPVRVVYLSNAESWFHYNSRFVHNIQSLPTDERGVVLRTVKSDVLRYAAWDAWHFSVQRIDDFGAKLGGSGYGRIDDIMADILPPGPAGLSLAAQSTLPGEQRRGLSHIALGVGPPKARRDAPPGLVIRPAGAGAILARQAQASR